MTHSDYVEHVDLIDMDSDSDANGSWHPEVGEETLDLLERLHVGKESEDVLLAEALDVLSRCVPPRAISGQDTGLVVGYVQSGKTASFTTVAALARDNGYRIVIVLSGLTKNLFEQSRDRLYEDLATTKGRYRWTAIDNPRVDSDLERIKQAVVSTRKHRTRTVLLTVMKNRAHLDQLLRILERLPLAGVPVLLIDDEADQASLNNEVRNEGESATYRRLLALRERIPHHTYLQYTATPQAPLLISLIDSLSPSFSVVLTPGLSYKGGRAFFDSDMDLIRRIPDSDLPTRHKYPEEPPESLIDALRIYWLGVASGMFHTEDVEGKNRSMMVHPLRYQAAHDIYHRWVRNLGSMWKRVLERGERNRGDADFLDLLSDFEEAYSDLERTTDGLPAFEELVDQLHLALDETTYTEVNSRHGTTPTPDWNHSYPHILTGADVLNRGYTIEGLTVSYMPRGLGTSQADTLQQRARWFGYKGDYLGYCRVYLSDRAIAAYRAYVDHEEHMRTSLRDFAATGKPLSGWKRAFFLDPGLRPTRQSVLSLEHVRDDFSKHWFSTACPHEPHEIIVENRRVVEAFIAKQTGRWQEDPGNPDRTSEQIHYVAVDLSLKSVYDELLTAMAYSSAKDSSRYTGLLLQISDYLERCGDDNAAVYQIRKGHVRKRAIGDDGAINNLFQGEYPPEPRHGVRQGGIYPGDRKIRDSDSATIQIHNLDLHSDGMPVATSVPALAVILPRRMSRHWLVQEDSEDEG